MNEADMIQQLGPLNKSDCNGQRKKDDNGLNQEKSRK